MRMHHLKMRVGASPKNSFHQKPISMGATDPTKQQSIFVEAPIKKMLVNRPVMYCKKNIDSCSLPQNRMLMALKTLVLLYLKQICLNLRMHQPQPVSIFVQSRFPSQITNLLGEVLHFCCFLGMVWWHFAELQMPFDQATAGWRGAMPILFLTTNRCSAWYYMSPM